MNFIPGDTVILREDARDYFGRVSVPAGTTGEVKDRVTGQLGPTYLVCFQLLTYEHTQRILGTSLELFDDEYQRNPG